MKMNKRKDGKISIVLDTKEAFDLYQIGVHANETGYYLDELRDYDEKRVNNNFFYELIGII